MTRVLFCVRNVKPAEYRRLVEAGATPHDCLERCRHCFDTPFVVVEDDDKNRTVIDSKTHDEVLKKFERGLAD